MFNLAGNPVSIFLFRFVLRQNAISYVVNETIAEDMYADINEQITPLVHACSETLLRYREKCIGNTIMDGNILTDGCFEVMLSQGLGVHFDNNEKNNLFKDAHKIAELLMEVMDRRSSGDDATRDESATINKIGPVGGHRADLNGLGEKQRLLDELDDYGGVAAHTKKKRLTPQDLPPGVKAAASYDHRGRCYSFEHADLGGLGKITVVPFGSNQIKLESEFYVDSRQTTNARKSIFEDVVKIISNRLDK